MRKGSGAGRFAGGSAFVIGGVGRFKDEVCCTLTLDDGRLDAWATDAHVDASCWVFALAFRRVLGPVLTLNLTSFPSSCFGCFVRKQTKVTAGA